MAVRRVDDLAVGTAECLEVLGIVVQRDQARVHRPEDGQLRRRPIVAGLGGQYRGILAPASAVVEPVTDHELQAGRDECVAGRRGDDPVPGYQPAADFAGVRFQNPVGRHRAGAIDRDIAAEPGVRHAHGGVVEVFSGTADYAQALGRRLAVNFE